MERHRCKLCYRNFSNGRALGGHMRSHVMKLYAAQKSSDQHEEDELEAHQPSDENLQDSDDSLSVHSYSTTSEYEEVKGLNNSSVLVQDRESETESFKVSRRSKRVRKSINSDFNGFSLLKSNSHEDEYEVTSSISDITPEEHVAHCLIMLSRDKWDIIEEKKNKNNIIIGDDYDDYSEDSDVVKVIKNTNKVRGKYRCETCNKLFKSYQALGGHRANHKKIKLNHSGGGSTPAPAVAPVEKVHQCPFCDRVFSSGQALGGHKRSHFVGAGAISGNAGKISRNGENLNIDLNLPAPIDDDEISQIAVSAVSDL